MARSKLAKVWEFRPAGSQFGRAHDGEAAAARPEGKHRAGTENEKETEKPADLRSCVIAAAFKQFDRFAALEAKVLRGEDARAIHDLRVATRRLQTAMDLLIPKPRPAEFRKVRRRLRRNRRVLSEARNCDVMLARADAALARKRTAHREAWVAFRDFLADRRKKALSKAFRKLSKGNSAISRFQLKHVLDQTVREPLDQAGTAQVGDIGERSQNQFEADVAARIQDARQAFEKRLEACLASPDSQASHQVRIAAKRLRYLIEILRDYDVRGASEALVWFRGIQKHLGDLHDTDVLEQMMIQMIAKPKYLQDHLDLAFQVAKIVHKIRRRKKTLTGKFVEVAADSAEYRRIQDWLAGLTESFSAAAATA